MDEVSRFVDAQRSGFINFIRQLISYHINKGSEYSKSGNINKSKAHFREALKFDPDNKQITKILNEMEGFEMTLASISQIAKPAGTAAPAPAGSQAQLPSGAKGFSGQFSATGSVERGPSKGLIAVIASGAVLLMAGVLIGVLFMGKSDVRRETAVQQAVVKPQALPAVRPDTAKTRPDTGMAAVKTAPEPSRPQTVTQPAPLSKKKEPAAVRVVPVPVKKAPVKSPAPQRPATASAAKQAGNIAGSLHVFAKPWAEFFIDGSRIGTTKVE